jgi:hypothetical protein
LSRCQTSCSPMKPSRRSRTAGMLRAVTPGYCPAGRGDVAGPAYRPRHDTSADRRPGATASAGPGITVLRGDITTVHVDAVVTAANRRLLGGSGVNGAVHAAAGPRLLVASRALAPCPPGSACHARLRPAHRPLGGPRRRPEVPRTAGRRRAGIGVHVRSRPRRRGRRHEHRLPVDLDRGLRLPGRRGGAGVGGGAARGADRVTRILLVAFGDRTEQLWAAELAR